MTRGGLEVGQLGQSAASKALTPITVRPSERGWVETVISRRGTRERAIISRREAQARLSRTEMGAGEPRRPMIHRLTHDDPQRR